MQKVFFQRSGFSSQGENYENTYRQVDWTVGN